LCIQKPQRNNTAKIVYIEKKSPNTHKNNKFFNNPVAPQQSLSILTTQQTDTTGSPFMNTSRGLLMLIGISLGTVVVLINILVIACCIHKRHKKNLKGGKGRKAEIIKRERLE
jgi:hypothetical protein